MELSTLWFILIAVLYIGYFILEGFDFGAGILLPFLGKNDTQRRVIINTIGPHWDGNEVWLLPAGGATFDAFPHWYAPLFSGFYLPLFLMLMALIVRGVAFEFRSKDENPVWRSFWDWAICVGSILPAFLWGVAFVNFIRGIPIDASMNYTGGFWNLLNPYALLGGMIMFLLCLLQGAAFLTLKTKEELMEKARAVARRTWLPAFLCLGLLAIASYSQSDIFTRNGWLAVLTQITAYGTLVALLVAGWFVRQKREGIVMIMTSVSLLLLVVTFFTGLYPRVLISSLDPAWSLTVTNSASKEMTLRVMSIVALIFVPLVLAYQGWTYWVFRKRIAEEPKSLEY